MIEEWFSPHTAGYFSFLSFLSFCALFGRAAKRGQLRPLVMGVWNVMIAFAVLLLASGVLGIAVDQPPHVWRPLLLSGFIVGAVFFFTRRGLVRCYTDAELRRTIAADL